jgi:Chaperone of endosialidase
MDKASEALLSLQPVTFRYKHDLDPDGIPQFGLVAEQVEKVSPDLVVRDDEGKVTTVRYEAVNAMLLNEFLKEHRKVQNRSTSSRNRKPRLCASGNTSSRNSLSNSSRSTH